MICEQGIAWAALGWERMPPGRPDYVGAGDEVLVKREWLEWVIDRGGKCHPRWRSYGRGGMSLEQQWRGYVRNRWAFCFRWWLTRQRRRDPRPSKVVVLDSVTSPPSENFEQFPSPNFLVRCEFSSVDDI